MGRSMTPPVLATPSGRFAHKLQSLKHRNGLTLATISAKSGISVATLSRAFSGRDLPSWETVRGIVEACGGNVHAWRRRYEDCRSTIRYAHLDEDWLMAEAIRHWTPSKPRVPPIVPATLGEYRLWLKVAKQFANRSFSELSRLSRLGQNSWSAESFACLVSGRRTLNPRCVLSFLMACGIARYTDLQRWLSMLAATVENNTRLRAEVWAAATALYASSIGADRREARAASAAGYQDGQDHVEERDSALESLMTQIADQVRWPGVDAVVKTSRGLMVVHAKHYTEPASNQLSGTPVGRIMRRAGLDPLTAYPGSTSLPWPSQCSNCGTHSAPSVSKAIRGHTCMACGWQGPGTVATEPRLPDRA
ncbi:helix-turn-helix domain-containing protein [Kitasatospora purpeofusca]|uniref:helix-turn-helix domain-containing protein n=1 Tax=Kitasatospora purpeofusca TaxID=67352 RepID=UPI0035E2F943